MRTGRGVGRENKANVVLLLLLLLLLSSTRRNHYTKRRRGRKECFDGRKQFGKQRLTTATSRSNFRNFPTARSTPRVCIAYASRRRTLQTHVSSSRSHNFVGTRGDGGGRNVPDGRRGYYEFGANRRGGVSRGELDRNNNARAPSSSPCVHRARSYTSRQTSAS